MGPREIALGVMKKIMGIIESESMQGKQQQGQRDQQRRRIR
jgi:hypothetical protein